MSTRASTAAAKDRIRLALAFILLERSEPFNVSIAALRAQIARNHVVPAARDALLSEVSARNPNAAMAGQLKRTLEEMQGLQDQLQVKDLGRTLHCIVPPRLTHHSELERLRAKKPKLAISTEAPTKVAKKAAKKTAQRLEKIVAVEQLLESHTKGSQTSKASLTESHQILCSLLEFQHNAKASKVEKAAAGQSSRLLPRIQAIEQSSCKLIRSLAISLPAIIEPSLSPTSVIPSVKELLHWTCTTAVQMLETCHKQGEKHVLVDQMPQIAQATSSAVNAMAIEVSCSSHQRSQAQRITKAGYAMQSDPRLHPSAL